MIVLNSIYEALKDQLKSIQTLKKIEWYNEQYTNMEEERSEKINKIATVLNQSPIISFLGRRKNFTMNTMCTIHQM